MTTSILEYLKHYYEKNELYCSICLERASVNHWVTTTCEGHMLIYEEMVYEQTQRRRIVYEAG